jgi:site-specific recombinase XerD
VQRTSKGKDGKQVAKRTTAQLSVADTARADHYARASRADNTWKAYQAAFGQFSAWCEGQGRSPMPADAASLREYVAALADAGRP